MKKLFTILTASVVGMSMVAQTPAFTNERTIGMVSAEFSARGEARAEAPTIKQGKSVVRKATASQDWGVEQPAALFEDFSKMSTGSLQNPDKSTDINYSDSEVENPDFNMKPNYTNTPGWGSRYCYPAGGAIVMDVTHSVGYGSLTTPVVDLSGFDGVATIRVKARTLQGESALYMDVVDATNKNKWTYLVESAQLTVSSEWQIFEYDIQNGSANTAFYLFTFGPSNVYIDEISVVQYDLYVGLPVIHQHSNYTGHSFDISWEPANKAQSYLVDVYTSKEELIISQGGYDYTEPVVDGYLYQDVPVTGTSWTVEGIESGETYFYSVRAVNGEYISMPMTPILMFDLETPQLADVENFQDDRYTASWNKVVTAEDYNYWAYCDRVATETGVFVVTNENFDGVTDFEGELTGWTKEDPSENTYVQADIPCTTQAGWVGKHYAPYTDYVCVDAWYFVEDSSQYGGIFSPELDLSKDGGKFKVSVDLASQSVFVEDLWLMGHYEQVGGAVALLNYDETVGDFVEAEVIQAPKLSETDWTTCEFEFTKGTERSMVVIYATEQPGNLYIDNLLITQNYEKGEFLRDPFLLKRYYTGTSINVEIPEFALGADLWHKVCATKTRFEYAGNEIWQRIKESEYSELINVKNGSNVESVLYDSEVNAYVENGELHVVNPSLAAIWVYDLAGNLIYSNQAGVERVNVTLPAKGFYVVKVGDKAVKVINR